MGLDDVYGVLTITIYFIYLKIILKEVNRSENLGCLSDMT